MLAELSNFKGPIFSRPFKFTFMLNDRIKPLDGLRGVAIIFVLLYHLFNFGILYPFFWFGWIGVDLFFVLSGFLITNLLLSTKNFNGYYKTFLLRRALRILPLYYLVVVLFAIIAPHFSTTKWFSEYQIFFWTHTSNFLFLNKGFFRPLGHFWSLAIEEQFYLIWPFFVLYLKSKQLIGVSAILIIISILIRSIWSENPFISYGMPLAHLDGLLIGSVISAALRTDKTHLFTTNINYIFIFCGLAFATFIAYGFYSKSELHSNPLSITVASFFFGCVLIRCLGCGWMAKMFSNSILVYFGKYSYGIYIFNSLFYHFANWVGVDKCNGNQKLFFYTLVLLLTLFVSYMSYNFFEIKFLNLKNRLTQRFVT